MTNQRDYFTLLKPSETQRLYDEGKAALLENLRQPVSGELENDVEDLGAFKSKSGDEVDKFSVNVASTNQADIQKCVGRFKSLGCTIAEHSSEVFVLSYRHADYDRRWCKINMTFPQWCTTIITLLLGLALLFASAIA